MVVDVVVVSSVVVVVVVLQEPEIHSRPEAQFLYIPLSQAEFNPPQV